MYMTIKTDEKTDFLIGRIRRDFGICCTAGVLRKALALLELARIVKEDGKELVLVDSSVRNVQRVEI